MLNEKIKSLIAKKKGKDNKKTIENLVAFLVLLVITIISINIIWGKDKKPNKSTEEETYKTLAGDVKNSNNSEIDTYNLEKKLEDILSKISGVGKVQVLVTYSSTSEIVAMQNEKKNTSKTEESDSNRWNAKN